MNDLPLFALDVATPGNLEQLFVRSLAVAGGAAVGGFGAGVVTQLVSRLLTTRKVPPLALRFVRLLGAAAVGIVAAILLFGSGGGWGGGGTGWGLLGGAGLDSGTGKGSQGAEATARATPPDKETRKSDAGRKEVPASATARVEVLGDDRVRDGRLYRFEGEERLRTLAEIRDALEARKKDRPPLEKVVLVIYQNSPDEQKHQVVALRNLAEDLGLTVGKDLPPRDAP